MQDTNTTSIDASNDPRGELIFGEPIDWADTDRSIVRFRDYEGTAITTDEARELVEQGYLDRDERQNVSPTVGEILEFADEWESDQVTFLLEGYVVSPERPGTRITVEGFVVMPDEDGGLPVDLVARLGERFTGADNYTIDPDGASFWWD